MKQSLTSSGRNTLRHASRNRARENISIAINIPENLKTGSKNTAYLNICNDNDSIYLIFGETMENDSAKANENVHIMKISADLSTSEVITVKNTTGCEIATSNRKSYIMEKYLLAFSTDYERLFKINLENPTDVSEIQYKYNGYYTSDTYLLSHDNKKLILNKGGAGYLIDLINNCANRHNGNINIYYERNYGYRATMLAPLLKCKEALFWIPHNTNSNDYHFSFNPLTLSTINNLSSPITKTSDMTMKITYTITSSYEGIEG